MIIGVAEMGQLQNEIQEHRRVLNLLLGSVRTMNPHLLMQSDGSHKVATIVYSSP